MIMLPQTPVTALKGHLGNRGAAGAVMELAASIVAMQQGCVPAVRNYQHPIRPARCELSAISPLVISRQATRFA